MSRLSARLAFAAIAADAIAAVAAGCAAQIDSWNPIGPQTYGPSIPLHPPLIATDYEYTLTLLRQAR
ncbi:MAG: hypothetical protein JWN61_1442 [Pseudonocardiales bacterium]|nr:hypothetical protein [Pseudonocardiales bacterium]